MKDAFMVFVRGIAPEGSQTAAEQATASTAVMVASTAAPVSPPESQVRSPAVTRPEVVEQDEPVASLNRSEWQHLFVIPADLARASTNVYVNRVRGSSAVVEMRLECHYADYRSELAAMGNQLRSKYEGKGWYMLGGPRDQHLFFTKVVSDPGRCLIYTLRWLAVEGDDAYRAELNAMSKGKKAGFLVPLGL